MPDPYLVTCLVTLRSEFSALDAGRDKDSDGWIGDEAHQQETSDHNPDSRGRVLAIDIDSTGPWPAPFGDIVESVRGDSRLEYVIWNRRIASRSHGWTWRAYDGKDPHTGHAHFSARHDHTGDTSTAPWGVEREFSMELTDEQMDDLADRVAARVWAFQLEDPMSTSTPKAKKSAGAYVRYGDALHVADRNVTNAARDAILAALPAAPARNVTNGG
jgi:hypothetical protein